MVSLRVRCMQSSLCLEPRVHPPRTDLSPLRFFRPFVFPTSNKQKWSGSAKWQFQSGLCQGPFRFQNIPIPRLISGFLLSDVYLRCLFACTLLSLRHQQILLQQLGGTGPPQRFISQEASQTSKEPPLWANFILRDWLLDLQRDPSQRFLSRT